MSWLATMLLSNTVVAIALAAVAYLVQRAGRRPALAHGLYLLAFVKLWTPTLVEVQLPAQWIPSPITLLRTQDLDTDRMSPSPAFFSSVREHSTDTRRSSQPRALLLKPRDRHRFPTWLAQLEIVLLGLWLTGCFAIVTNGVLRTRRFHRFVRRASPADSALQAEANNVGRRLGLRSIPLIRIASGTFPPLLWTTPQSAYIVVPRGLTDTTTKEQRSYVLAHELAHFARADHWVRRLEAVTLAVFWWHPLVWWIRHQLQHTEELCCDAWVLWAYPQAQIEYAQTLLATLDFLADSPQRLPTLASGLGPAHLVRDRFRRLLHDPAPRCLSKAGLVSLITAGCLAIPWTGTLGPRDATAATASVRGIVPATPRPLGSTAIAVGPAAPQAIRTAIRDSLRQIFRKGTRPAALNDASSRGAPIDALCESLPPALRTLVRRRLEMGIREFQAVLQLDTWDRHFTDEELDEIALAIAHFVGEGAPKLSRLFDEIERREPSQTPVDEAPSMRDGPGTIPSVISAWKRSISSEATEHGQVSWVSRWDVFLPTRHPVER